ncbi:Uncharacterised protein [uncultured archaeon]|nr:Uncharacterised protein [uncultured archaeon]
MKKISVALVVLVVLGLMATTSPALYAHSLMQPAKENTALNKMGQIEDNITRPLNYGEERINNSIDLTEGYMSQTGTATDAAALFLFNAKNRNDYNGQTQYAS